MRKPLQRNCASPLQNRGAVLSGCLLFLVIVAALGYVGYKIGEPCWEYLEVRQKTKEALNWAAAGQPKPEAEIIQKVIANNRETNVDIRERNVRIIPDQNLLIINVSWKREVPFPFYTLPLNFRVTLSEEKRWHRGGLIIK